MNSDATIIDRIVNGVLTQLSAKGHRVASERPTPSISVSREATPSDSGTGETIIGDRVVTADVIAIAGRSHSRLIVDKRAIVTPAAWDLAKEKRIEIVRGNEDGLAAHLKRAAKPELLSNSAHSLMIVVRSTDAVERLWDDLKSSWRRELLGCPDDAAELATSAVCRGESDSVVILAEQTHRAACLANRNERAKAVAICDGSDVRSIRNQLRANIWCLDPTGRSWFELRNTLKAISEN